jgi:hypothetical protein
MYGDPGQRRRLSDQPKGCKSRNHGSNTGRRRTFISSPRCSDRLWDAQRRIIWVSRSVKLTAQPQSSPDVKNERSVTSIALYAFMGCTGRTSSWHINMYEYVHFFYHGAKALVGQGLLIFEDSWSHSDTPHSVGLLWMRDQHDAETSTWKHTTLARDRHKWPRRDRNPQSQQEGGRRPRLRRLGNWDRRMNMFGIYKLTPFVVSHTKRRQNNLRWISELNVWTVPKDTQTIFFSTYVRVQ